MASHEGGVQSVMRSEVEANGAVYPVLQLFEAQETAATAARVIYAFMRKSIEVRYGVTGTAPARADAEQMET